MGVQLELVLAVHLRMVAAGLTPPTRTLMAVMRAGEKTGAWELASEVGPCMQTINSLKLWLSQVGLRQQLLQEQTSFCSGG